MEDTEMILTEDKRKGLSHLVAYITIILVDLLLDLLLEKYGDKWCGNMDKL